MANEIQPGVTCPECGTEYDLSNNQGATRVFGRNYRWRNALNRVVKCAFCGNIHSWDEAAVANFKRG